MSEAVAVEKTGGNGLVEQCGQAPAALAWEAAHDGREQLVDAGRRVVAQVLNGRRGEPLGVLGRRIVSGIVGQR